MCQGGLDNSVLLYLDPLVHMKFHSPLGTGKSNKDLNELRAPLAHFSTLNGHQQERQTFLIPPETASGRASDEVACKNHAVLKKNCRLACCIRRANSGEQDLLGLYLSKFEPF